MPVANCLCRPERSANNLKHRAFLPRHIEAVRHLACAHADPFDRLLIAQARDERVTLLTRDAALLKLGLTGVVKA